MNRWFALIAALLILTVMQVTCKSLSVDVYPGQYVPIIEVHYGKN
jgi:hypothetical protein